MLAASETGMAPVVRTAIERLVDLIDHGAGFGDRRFHVPHDADDLAPAGTGAVRFGEAPPEGIFTAEQSPGRGFADQKNLRRCGGVVLVEGAAGEHAGAEGIEIAGTHAVDDRGGFVAQRGTLAAFNDEFPGVRPVEEGGERREADRRNAGQGRKMFQGEALEGGDLLRVRVVAGWQQEGAGDQVVGSPAGAAIVQIIEAADENAGAREQDHRDGKLADDEEMAETLVSPAARRAPTALQRLVQVEAQGEQRRGDTESQGGDE